jgi:hypothetical protein
MINFFRSIRQTFLTEGKTSKYLKYAIGEIVLVVIGILIALQINNWNEHRKELLNEKAVLSSLKEELNSTLQELKNDLKVQNNYKQSTENVYSYIQNKPKLVDSMYKDFYSIAGLESTFPKTSVYKSLISGNIEIIKSDTLRKLITDIYETLYPRIISKVNIRLDAAGLIFPYYQKHFKSKMTLDSITNRRSIKNIIGIPNDYEALINDPEFETLIIEAIKGRIVNDRFFSIGIQKVEECITKIDTYLKP